LGGEGGVPKHVGSRKQRQKRKSQCWGGEGGGEKGKKKKKSQTRGERCWGLKFGMGKALWSEVGEPQEDTLWGEGKEKKGVIRGCGGVGKEPGDQKN